MPKHAERRAQKGVPWQLQIIVPTLYSLVCTILLPECAGAEGACPDNLCWVLVYSATSADCARRPESESLFKAVLPWTPAVFVNAS